MAGQQTVKARSPGEDGFEVQGSTAIAWMERRALKTAIALAALVLLLGSGCSGVTIAGESQTESTSVALGGAESVRATVSADGSDLRVVGRSQEDLLVAEISSNTDEGKPEIDYGVSGGKGTLELRELYGDGMGLSLGNVTHDWNLWLNDRVPFETLSIVTDTGNAALDLSGLPLSKLDVDSGTGALDIDLGGGRSQDLDATIAADTGPVTLWLPRDVGVRVDVDAGVGSVNATGLLQDTDAEVGRVYVNDAFDDSETILRIDVVSDVGDINLGVSQPSGGGEANE